MFDTILNFLFVRNFRTKLGLKKLLKCFESEASEEFLKILLKAMCLVLFIDRDYRKNIKNFNGKYLFKSNDNSIKVAAFFKNNRMKVTEDVSSGYVPNVTLDFRNSKALMDFIMNPNPDVIKSIMNQDLVMNGNFNYLLKFAYMAKHLRLKALGAV